MKFHASFLLATAATTSVYVMISATSKVEISDGGGRKKSPDFDEKTDDAASCGLYLATSSTSGVDEMKLGVYAGKDIEADSPVGFGDLAINIFHLMANNVWIDPETEEILDDLDRNELANIVDWLEQFVWVPHSSGGQFEIEDTENGA